MVNNRARQLYLSLQGLYRASENEPDGRSGITDEALVKQYEKFLVLASQSIPGLLMDFESADVFSHQNGLYKYYYLHSLQANMGMNLGILKSLSEESVENAVITPHDFSFIHDIRLRQILERDDKEIQRNIISGNYKSTILLCGGCIEAILLSLCMNKEAEARTSPKAPGKKIDDWVLNDLIDVCVDLKWVADALGKLSHSVRDYRNLIHPALELKKSLKIEAEEAKIAVEILNILIRELS